MLSALVVRLSNRIAYLLHSDEFVILVKTQNHALAVAEILDVAEGVPVIEQSPNMSQQEIGRSAMAYAEADRTTNSRHLKKNFVNSYLEHFLALSRGKSWGPYGHICRRILRIARDITGRGTRPEARRNNNLIPAK